MRKIVKRAPLRAYKFLENSKFVFAKYYTIISNESLAEF